MTIAELSSFIKQFRAETEAKLSRYAGVDYRAFVTPKPKVDPFARRDGEGDSAFACRLLAHGMAAPTFSSMAGNWAKLFKAYDRDGSGEITFDELRHVVRRELKIGARVLPEPRLEALFLEVGRRHDDVAYQ